MSGSAAAGAPAGDPFVASTVSDGTRSKVARAAAFGADRSAPLAELDGRDESLHRPTLGSFEWRVIDPFITAYEMYVASCESRTPPRDPFSSIECVDPELSDMIPFFVDTHAAPDQKLLYLTAITGSKKGREWEIKP